MVAVPCSFHQSVLELTAAAVANTAVAAPVAVTYSLLQLGLEWVGTTVAVAVAVVVAVQASVNAAAVPVAGLAGPPAPSAAPVRAGSQ